MMCLIEMRRIEHYPHRPGMVCAKFGHIVTGSRICGLVVLVIKIRFGFSSSVLQ